MKKSKRLYGIIGMIICMILCSCSTAPQTTQSTGRAEETASQSKTASPKSKNKNAKSKTDTESLESVYPELMDDIHDLILAEDHDTDSELAAQTINGILDAGYSRTPEETLKYVGYALQDLNADGMPELVIVGINEERDGKFFGSDIYAVYTCVQEEISCICSGWSRNHVGWMGENTFYLLGSGGASDTMLGHYELLPNAAEWSCIDLYFTDEDGIYHNQTGICDKEQAETLNMTQDEFWELDDEFHDRVLDFELMPFSSYAPASH